ncbi:MAG: hypothetical protein GXP47_11495 [Acidobacteria bacterium]|nr:hypothetical protein [Acidobacteriota bacterium]
MSRSRQLVLAAVVVAGALAALLLVSRPAGLDEASSVSRRSGGLLLARRYLESRGVRCTTFTGRVGKNGPGSASLVVAFPATGRPRRAGLLRLKRWISGGGTLVVLFDHTFPGVAQKETLEALGVATRPIWRREELNPFRWWTRVRRPWRLSSPVANTPIVLSSEARVALKPHAGDVILLEEPKHNAVLGLARTVGRGRLVILPSEVLSNGRLLEGGNADLLEWLGRRLPSPDVAFDEGIHGLGAPAKRGAEGTPMADALLAQLALLYLLAIVALARRQGPPWPEEAVRGSSVGGLLLRLGAVHRRMGHHADAARVMVERAAAFGGWDSVPADLQEIPPRLDGPGLIRLAQRVARRQEHDRRKER